MNAKQLIEKLKELPQDKEVIVCYSGSGGCGTCGYGSEEEMDIDSAVFNVSEDKIILGW